jgi:hypothetical protein
MARRKKIEEDKQIKVEEEIIENEEEISEEDESDDESEVEDSSAIKMRTGVQLHCWQCMGFYSDGKRDCENLKCPLYKWMPYRKMEPDFELFQYSPRRTGKVKLEDCKREMTDEQRAEAGRRLQESRTKNN